MASNKVQFTSNVVSIGVVASNLQQSLDFYTQVIGMQKTGGFSIDAQLSKTSGLAGGIPFDVTILQLANDPSATQYKIMSFNKPKGWFWRWKHRFIQRGLGVRYITILVEDLSPIQLQMKNQNIPALGDTPIPMTFADGTKVSYLLIQDPDGVFIELIAPVKTD